MGAFRISFTTRDRMTVECDTIEEAWAKGRSYADRFNKEHHHGEVTTFEVVDLRADAWMPLSEIPDGSIFETRDGIKAVKSEYRYSNEYPAIQCILLASGEYAHFAQHIKDPIAAALAHNATAVRVLTF